MIFAKVEGLESLQAKLQQRVEAAEKDGKLQIRVGYTAPYAVYVHENVEMKLAGQSRPGQRGFYWSPVGRATPKFLEKPLRRMTNDGTFRRILTKALEDGDNLEKALLKVGLALQRESQMLVPVDTGYLKSTAFTRVAKK